MSTPLPREFFARDPHQVAPELIGKLLVAGHGAERVVVRLTETEAYSDDDPASHTYRGMTARNAVMFGEPGHLYVYFSYGIHHCANAVSHADGRSGGVLLRAGAVVEGAEIARTRRGNPRDEHLLARGPGCLAQALGITLQDGGADLCSPSGAITLLDDGARPEVRTGPRVGVRLAPDTPWRFWAAGERSVSVYKRSPRAAPDAR
ncbi:DNA-3-methyladenine glycosylase [Blastococcus sp. Marseille-P5729]|uniref:DNA-3-methyladenine glycosylase n=1 Tax=Blastococcus sp. Marseille-P5729 TaxID=2086582 RepID=UPI000D11153F|nr:DNA-3-methyladenine glycosylase [Blastococcus sp. Marseille-P5729]